LTHWPLVLPDLRLTLSAVLLVVFLAVGWVRAARRKVTMEAWTDVALAVVRARETPLSTPAR
jgi:hypothetical protein